MSIVRRNGGEVNGSNSSGDFWDLNLWDPFVDFPLSLPPRMINCFPGFGSVDWRETARAHVWQVVVPEEEEVLVELQDERMLQVSVESGNFVSRFRIPDNANLEQLKADMRHGVLLVTVPKFPQQPPNRNVRLIQIDSTN
ncbi:hypothetical protein Fmac_022226 [Flemingia macrophylla]|uniref:SHSP domain-containing protein n=1 Tax=Flemingia macrophylla TaxID=520843 RepID=A0ABD1LZ41_9FABA